MLIRLSPEFGSPAEVLKMLISFSREFILKFIVLFY